MPTRSVEVLADPESVIRLRDLRQERDRLRQAAVLRQDPTPGALAMRLDPATIQTPALEIIDNELVLVRDAVACMYERRARLLELRAQGVDLKIAVEQAAEEIPQRGNNRLILSMPPQEGKTTRVSRYGLLWLLRQFPTLRPVIVSYDGDKAAEPSLAIRTDIELFDGTNGNTDLGLRLVRDQKARSRYALISGGTVFAIGIGGGLTGRPADLLDIDDPTKDAKAADSLLQSEQQAEWYVTVARPRLAPWAVVMLTMTRWDERDLAGRLKTKEAEDEASGVKNYDKWRVVNIPAKADHDPDAGETDVLGREPGEYMLSARGRTREAWEATEVATPPRNWYAMYQGRPTPGSGEVWLKDWWRFYDTALWSIAEDGTFRLPGDVSQSWDFAFKDRKSSDYVVGEVWTKRGADSYLIYTLRRRLSFTDSLEAMRRVTRLFPQARRKIVELKANGDAVVDSLKHEIPGIIGATPTTAKQARAEAVSPYIRAGNVWLPTQAVASLEPAIAWDVDEFVAEATSFPRGQHDDQVDATSQYLFEVYLGSGGPASILGAEGMLQRRSNQTQPLAMPPPEKLSPMQRRLHDRGFPNGNGHAD